MTSANHDALNRLTSQQGGGALVFNGTVSEPGSVTIQGKPVTVDSTNRFRGSVPAPNGTTTVVIAATDGSGNQSTATYEVDQASTSKAFTYDANGNLTSDGTRTFEWDARNQLIAVNVGTHRSEFTYDGLQRRIRVVEKESGVTQSDTRVLWCRVQICEDRNADGTTVTRRTFQQGEQVAGVGRFFASDHLGSVTEVTDGMSAVLVRYAFDPWGRRTVTTGTDATNVGYAAYQWRTNGDVSFTLHRGYDAELGRWLSQDPIGFQGGSNYFAYAENNPVRFTDPLGLAIWVCTRKGRGAVMEAFNANHSYFWDDRNGSCCGASNQESCHEGGPGSGDVCKKVAESEGKEDDIMKCCKGQKAYIPLVNDCFTDVKQCLGGAGLKNPNNVGRFGQNCDQCEKKK